MQNYKRLSNEILKKKFLPIKIDDRYGVSESGEVSNLLTGKLLKPTINGNGYLLFNAGAKHKLTVHRQVAQLYVPNPNNYPVINHKDGNKLNNHFSNLEWTTYSGNTRHAFDTGLIDRKKLGRLGKLNSKSKPVLQLTKEGVLVREWDCTIQAEREAGFNSATISETCNGKHKSHRGFIFKYK